MPIELVFSRQERPAGLSTLEQVRALAEGVQDVAQTAAADAVAEAMPRIETTITEAAGQAATDAAAAVAPIAADAIRAQVAADADRAEEAASNLTDTLPTAHVENQITPLQAIGGDMAIWHDGEGVDLIPTPSLGQRLVPSVRSQTTDNLITPITTIGSDLAIWHDGKGIDLVPSPKLSDRISAVLPSGQQRPKVYHAERKRYLQMKLAANMTGRPDQLRIAVIGDSWSQLAGYYISELRLLFGNAGYDHAAAGFIDWSQDNAGWAGVSNARSGAWTFDRNSATGPSLTWSTASSAASGSITADRPHDVWRLIYLATGGVIEYSFDDGASWSSLALAGSGVSHADLTPAAAATKILMRWVSGTVTVAGFDLRSSSGGIVWHKLGRSGSDTSRWTTGTNRQQWVSAFSSLDVDSVVILIGTNDATLGTDPSQYATNLIEIVSRIREAKPGNPPITPGPDIILCPSPDVYRPSPISMTPYLDAVLAIADDLDASVINLQGVLGNPAYHRGWFDGPADGSTAGLHPDRGTGSLVIAKAMFDALSAI